MGDLEHAMQLFTDAGLAFPTIPEELGVQLMKRDQWLFSTRALKISPYNLDHYVQDRERTGGKEYTVLCHSGYGVNSYAIQYYLVYGRLRMFLHLGWGGVYMDADAAASRIRECFSLADQIVPAAMTSGQMAAGQRLTIVGSDFYGSYWSAQEQTRQEVRRGSRGPAEVLAEVLRWLKDLPPNQRLQPTASSGG